MFYFFVLISIYELMDLSFLPLRYVNVLNNSDIEYLYEIRMRVGFAVKVKVKNNTFFLTDKGYSLFEKEAINCTVDDVLHVIKSVTEYSVYAYNDKIKNGYLTTDDGIRIGIAGECVIDNEKVQTIKKFSSLNIRIPHEIIGCADKLYEYLYDKSFFNTLIVSPPFYGKTTLLKDLARTINNKHNLSILVIDERGEFKNVKGVNIDSIKFSDKYYAFNCGIRALSPSIVITDELSTKSDWLCALRATVSGVKIIASAHGSSLSDVIMNENYIGNIFERFIILESKGHPGVINKVYNSNFDEI